MIEFEHISYNDPVFDEVIDQVKKTVSNYDSSLLIKYLNEEHKTRKYYSITKQGCSLLDQKAQEWKTYARAVGNVLVSCVLEG